MDSKNVATANRVVPRFESEAEEVEWWAASQNLIEQDLIDALQSGEIATGRPVALQYKVASSAPSAITLDAEDERRACEVAAKRGESFEGFVRRVVHQALELEKTA